METGLAITIIIGIGSIITMLFISMKETSNAYKRALEQAQQSFFAEYTKRYQLFVMTSPDDVYFGNADVTPKTLKYVQVYFDLCNEEFLLYKRGQIDSDVWENWKEGMEFTARTAKGNLYIECWKKIKTQGYYNSDFVNFYEKEILKIN